MTAALLFSVPLTPFLLAFAVLRWRCLSRWTGLGLLPALLVLILLKPDVQADYDWWLLGSRMGLDHTAYVVLCFTWVLWLAAGLFANGEVEDAGRGRFSFFFLTTMSGNLGVILAQDAALFYFFFALMSFASYGLVAGVGDRSTQRSGLVYLIGIIIGELALFVAFVILHSHAGGIGLDLLGYTPLRESVVILLLIGFGIKSGLLLMHVWMPLAYAAAPTAAAVVLAGAMVKAGLVGWLRFLPLGWEVAPLWGQVFLVTGFAGVYYGALVGLVQRNPRVILAYSSVSQMGLLTALVGLGLMAPQHWPLLLTVTLIYAAHHAIVKGTLFMGLDVLASAGRPGQRRWLMVAYGMVALAMAGGPLLSGAVAKLAYKSATAVVFDLTFFLGLSSIATTLLMARLLDCLRYFPASQQRVSRGPWYFLLLVLLLWPWVWPAAREYMFDSLAPGMLVSSAWPILVGGGAYVLFTFLQRFMPQTPKVSIPPGDILYFVEMFFVWVRALLDGGVKRVGAHADMITAGCRRISAEMTRWLRIAELEQFILRWETAWGLYLGLIGLVLLLSFMY